MKGPSHLAWLVVFAAACRGPTRSVVLVGDRLAFATAEECQRYELKRGSPVGRALAAGATRLPKGDVLQIFGEDYGKDTMCCEVAVSDGLHVYVMPIDGDYIVGDRPSPSHERTHSL